LKIKCIDTNIAHEYFYIIFKGVYFYRNILNNKCKNISPILYAEIEESEALRFLKNKNYKYHLSLRRFLYMELVRYLLNPNTENTKNLREDLDLAGYVGAVNLTGNIFEDINIILDKDEEDYTRGTYIVSQGK
jgi:hypothetical protein